MKLKYKLPIYYSIIGVVCILSFGFIAINANTLITGLIQDKYNKEARSISENIDSFLGERIMDIESLTKNNFILNSLQNNNTDSLQKELYNYIMVNNSFNYISIQDSKGTIIGRSDIVQRGKTDYYYIIKEEGKKKIGTIDVKYLNNDNSGNILVSEIIKNEYNQDSIDVVLLNTTIGGKKYYFIGNVKINFINKLISKNYLLNNALVTIKNYLGKDIYVIKNKYITNTDEKIEAYSLSQGLGKYSWKTLKIEIKQSMNIAMKDIYYLITLLVLVMLFIIFSIVFLIVIIYKNFSKPLSKLLKTVKEIAECDSMECNYATGLELDRTDEIGILSKGFNKMLGNIRGNIKVLNEYKSLIDESSIVSKCDKKGKITYVNDKFCETSNYTRKQLIGKDTSIVRHSDESDDLFEDLWSTVNLKKTWKGVIKYKRKNGEAYWASMIVAPLLDINNEIIEYISIGSDVTELEQTKVELKQSYTKLQDSTTKLIEKERIGKEFELAEQIQNDFLPKVNEVNIEGLQIHFGVTAATEIGGDLYDIIKQKSDPNKILLYIGDVTGHGLISGMMMAVCNTLVYSLANQYTNMVDILKYLNSALFNKLPNKVFITMLMMQYDIKEGTFSYLGAGHEKILIYRKDKDKVEEIKSGGDALGMFGTSKKDLQTNTIATKPGDIILLYTDGIPEARNKKGEFYGLDKLIDSFKSNAHRKVDAIYESVEKDLLDYIGGAEILDDITMFIIKKD